MIKLTYIEYLNDFNQWLETNALPVSSQLMYYKLLHVFNRAGWPKDVGVDNLRIQMMIEAKTEKTAIQARDRLVKAGFVTYRKGKKGTPNRYSLKKYTLKNYSVSDSINDSINDSVSDSTNYSHIKTKTKTKTNNSPPIPPTGAELGFGKELATAFDDWLQYKRERKDKPYTPTGLKSVITQIRNNTAKYGENAVAELIQECMAANYQGIIWERLEKRGNMSGKGYVTAQQAQAKNAGAHGPTREDLDRMKRLMATMKGEKEAEQ